MKKIYYLVFTLFLIATLGSCTIVEKSDGSKEIETIQNVYDTIVEDGYTGSYDEWLKSLVNVSGEYSAYDLACQKGYKGSLEDWMNQMVSTKGQDGQDAYELAIANGYVGTKMEWIESLAGEDGKEVTFAIADNYLKWQYVGGSTWANLISLSDLIGATGPQGAAGKEVTFTIEGGYIKWQYVGDTEWTNLISLASLTGSTGPQGAAGKEVTFTVDGGYIKWQYVGDSSWTNLIEVATLTGQKGETGANGTNGKNVEMQVANGYLQYRLVGAARWSNLVELASLTGATGPEGPQGAAGKEVTFTVEGGYIKWQYVGDTEWTNLISLASLTGATGPQGTAGKEVTFTVEGGYIKWQYVGDASWTNLIEIATLTGANGTNGKDVEMQVANGYIQYRLVGAATWTNLIRLTALTGPEGPQGTAGKEVTFTVEGGYIKWQYVGDTEWKNLIEIATLKGANGPTGPAGPTGPTGPQGREVKLTVEGGYIKWQYEGDSTWTNLIEIATLVGQAGNSWLTGAGVPENTLGKDNDLYANTDNWDIYKKTVGTWSKIGSLKAVDSQTFTVTYNYNMPTSLADYNITSFKTSDSVQKANWVTLPEMPSDISRFFLGWYTGNSVNDAKFSNYTSVMSDVTLYAKWDVEALALAVQKPNQGLTFEFDSVNQTYTLIGVENNYGENIYLPELYLDGVNGLHYITKIDCTIENKNLVITDSIVTITENSIVNTKIFNFGSSKLAGWNLPNDAKVYYANEWNEEINNPVPATYTITYDLDGGTWLGAAPTSYQKFDTTAFEEPVKYQYTFIGFVDVTSNPLVTDITGLTEIINTEGRTGNLCLKAVYVHEGANVNGSRVTISNNATAANENVTIVIPKYAFSANKVVKVTEFYSDFGLALIKAKIDFSQSFISTLSANAFKSYKGGSITIPSGVTTIPYDCFSGTNAEIDYETPGNITTLGAGAFSHYAGTNITVPSGITTISSLCFSETSADISYQTPQNITTIAVDAFNNYSGAKIIIPSGVVSFGSSCFKNCAAFIEYQAPNNITTISANTFYYYNGPTIVIPNATINVSNLFDYLNGKNIFLPGTEASYAGNTTANNIYYQGEWNGIINNPIPTSYTITYDLDGGTLGGNAPTSYQKFDTTVLVEPTKDSYKFLGFVDVTSNPQITDLTGLSKITSVAGKVGNLTLKAVYAHNSTSSSIDGDTAKVNIIVDSISGDKNSTIVIPGYMFKENVLIKVTNFAAIDGPENTTGLDGVKATIDFSKSNITKLYTLTFKNYGGDNITIPSGVTTIPSECFAGTSATIYYADESKITSLASNAFEFYIGDTIIIPSGVTVIPSFCFYENFANISYSDESKITNLASNAFTSYRGGTIKIPSGVTAIPSYCFDGASATIDYGTSKITTLEVGAFRNYRGTKVVIPDRVTTIPTDCFDGCTSKIDYGTSEITTLAENAFNNYYPTNIVVPNTVTSIHANAFANVTGINIYVACLKPVFDVATVDSTNKVYYTGQWNEDYNNPIAN